MATSVLTPEVKRFIVKYAMVSSIVVWLIASHLKDFNSKFIEYLTKPLFSIDLDSDGEPDLQQLSHVILVIGRFKFPIGKMLYEMLKILLELLMIYLTVYFILNYTNIVLPH